MIQKSYFKANILYNFRSFKNIYLINSLNFYLETV